MLSRAPNDRWAAFGPKNALLTKAVGGSSGTRGMLSPGLRGFPGEEVGAAKKSCGEATGAMSNHFDSEQGGESSLIRASSDGCAAVPDSNVGHQPTYNF
eukprot:SAG31_NODE_522_length_14623_cov_6.071674_1_plen_99_part_00